MKKLLNLSLLTTLLSSVFFFAGCTPEGEGDFALSVKEVGADYVDIFVTAPGTLEMAYIVSDEAQLVTPAVLFATGKVITINPGDKIRINENIQQDTHYYFYAVAKLDASNYSERIVLEFDTKKYQFDELITIVDTYYDGYKAHITVPQETKDRGHAIRTGSMPLAWYNLMSSSKSQAVVDLQAIASTGNPYEGHMFTDSTIVLNNDNVVLLDENGDPVLDENNEQIDIHDPIVPGEPIIIFAGETRYGTPDDFTEVVGYQQPTEDSWAVPYYDPSKKEWLGAFQKKEFFAKQPSLCDATVEIEIPEDEITVTDAMIYFNMSDDAHSYFYMVLDNSTYNQILSMYLKGNEDWYQWFLTSYIAFYEWGVFPETENIAINAASSFVEPLTGGDTYHVLMTVFGDELGASQRYVHKTFQAKEKTKVAPAIEVTAVPSDDPYTATFNIKAAADSQGNIQPVMGAYWVCNYSREFELMFNSGYTYATLLKNMGYTFESEEVAMINSEEGLTVTFQTLDGEVTRFAAYGCNDEYTFNVIDENNTLGWADYKSPMAETVSPISSPLFEQLEGDWTATATLRAMQQETDGTVITYNVDHKSKITISSTAPELPASLDAGVYDLYKNDTKEEVDNMFAELGELTDIFTEYRLKGQNRLLCCGFMDFDPAAPSLGVNRLEFRSPYDLFVATDYSSVDIAQLMYDFGPKWFLEVREDGSVIVPFHSMMLPPLQNWPGYPFYIGGVADGQAFYDANADYPGFPVEISDDLNTITIKPIVLTDGVQTYSYYMNAIGANPQQGLEIISTVITEIVLKRGWTEIPAATSYKEYGYAPCSVNAVDMNGAAVSEMPKAAICKSLSDFEGKQMPAYTIKEKANVVTKDMVDETSAKILRKFGIE